LKKRQIELKRQTTETVVNVKLNIDGNGDAQLNTGVNFFNHLLGALTKHSLFDLKVDAKSITAVDEHHIIEDVGITLGQALDSALGNKAGIRRFGHAMVPMDDSLVAVAVDISGRAYTTIQADFKRRTLGDMATELIPHFLESFALNGKFTLHVNLLYGKNDHHKAEAIFKALGIALGSATQFEPRLKGKVPSQKGAIS